jgi:hypothetical protein
MFGVKPLSSSRKKYTLCFSITLSLLFQSGIKSFSLMIFPILVLAVLDVTKDVKAYPKIETPNIPPILYCKESLFKDGI